MSARIYRSIISNLNDFLFRMSQKHIDIGALIICFVCISYHYFGFNFVIFAAWLIGMATSGYRLFKTRASLPIKVNRLDLFTLPALFLVALPFFVWSVYTVPFQLNSDEIAVIKSEQVWTAAGITDLFGLSNYFGFTYFHFLVEGWLAKLLGGIDLLHVRFLHSLSGTIIVPLSFVFFRVVGLRWWLSIAASLFICSNHALIDLSRMANITNFPLLVELCALAALFEGLKRHCPFISYLGGILAGLGFYVYYPARVIMPIWITFLSVLLIVRRREFSVRKLARLLMATLFGLVLAVAPLAIAHERQRQQVIDSIAFQKHQCLLYPEGRELNKYWTTEKTIEAGVLRNIQNGLTAFNNNLNDEGYQYFNPGHGFVDPLSGVLLWVGFLSVILFARTEPSSLLILSGFLLQMFSFAFLITKAPNYTRMLVVLPFAGYFVACGIGAITSIFNRLLKERWPSSGLAIEPVVTVTACLAIIVWNLFIFHDFTVVGAVNGDDVGGTVRYVYARRNQPSHLFITAASSKYPYYRTDGADYWTYTIEHALGPGQECMVFAPQDLTVVPVEPPFTFLMNNTLWQENREQLTKMYPNLTVHEIFKQTGSLAIENTTVTPNSARAHAEIGKARAVLPTITSAFCRQDFNQARDLCLGLLNSPQAMANGTKFKADVLVSLGRAYGCLGKEAEAERTLVDALKLRQSISGDNDDPEIADYLDTLANTYYNEGKWSEAEVLFRREIQLWEKVQIDDLHESVPPLISAHRSLGLACQKQGKFAEAKRELLKAIEICSPNKFTSQNRATMAGELASCEKERRDFVQTLSQQKRVIR